MNDHIYNEPRLDEPPAVEISDVRKSHCYIERTSASTPHSIDPPFRSTRSLPGHGSGRSALIARR
ncbi:MAG: hypothetical protein J7J06_10505 [Methanosarcinales archaeon]|nr:hypothetical protein [Methanosarcinales archaeon]